MPYFQPNMEEIARLSQQAEEKRKSSGNNDFRNLKLENGNTTVLILPPYSERGLFVKKVFKHWNLGDDGKNIYDCLESTYPEDVGIHCPVCHVLKVLSQQGIDEKDLSPFVARSQTYVNVLVSEIGGEPVNEEDHPWLPHILRGPSSLGDFINNAVKEKLSSEFFDPKRSIPLQIKRTEKKVKGRSQVKYEYQWVPDRLKIASTPEEREEILGKMYDLDKVFKKVWDGDVFDEGVVLANTLLDSKDFSPLDSYPGRPAGGGSEKKSSNKKAVATGSPRRSGPVPASSEGDSEDDDKDADGPAERVVKDEPEVHVKNEVVPGKPVSKKLLKDGSGEPEIERDSEKLDEETGKPLCFGRVESCDVCNSCDFQDKCIVETVQRRSQRKK